jgi:hypothetical protein
MLRKPSIGFRGHTGCYMTIIRGVAHKLAKTEPEARKAFYKLMAAAAAAPALERKPERHSVRWLCDKYLDRTKAGKDPETWKEHLGHLKKFTAAFGTRPADSLAAYEVNDWFDGTEWGGSEVPQGS